MYENAYDSQSKTILSNKAVLSYIMKECVPKYKDLSRQEIKKLIDDNSDSRFISGIGNEDNSINNARIDYDILFYSKLPNSNENIGMYINIEAQNAYNPDYHLINRAVYYASRLISRQKGNIKDYNHLKKVYSIWVCVNPKKELADTINSYSIKETNIKGNYHIKDDYKFINIIMLNVGKNYNFKDNQSDILKMLSLLFKDNGLNPNEVSTILKKDYDIIMSKKEVSEVINLSQGSYAEAFDDGYQRANEATARN